MSQHDMTIDNGAGLPVRTDINNALQALASQSSGASAPSPPFPCQVWADTATGRKKRRNSANSAWLDEGPLDSPLRDAASQGEYVADTGAANAYVCNFVPAITARSESTPLRFKVTNANSGACTINDGVGVVALVGSNNSPLQGGELVANGIAWIQWNSSVGGGSYVLLFCTGVVAYAGHGQCVIGYVSATSIKMSPKGGNGLIIAGILRRIPSAGVTLSNGSLSASTLYYIYAVWSGTAITLEASTTGHSIDSVTGVEIKTGDATRTLVGMIYTNASSQFADSAMARHVASYFNRRSVAASFYSASAFTYNTTSATEVSASLRISFLTWGDEAVDIEATGQYSVGASQSVVLQQYVDGAGYGNTSATFTSVSAAGSTFSSGNNLTPAGAYLSEGQHISQIFGSVSGSTGSINYISHRATLRI